MNTQARYVHEDVQPVPAGYHVRTVERDGHEVRLAFPPGSRLTGSGVVVSVLHPPREKNCTITREVQKNPIDLIGPILTGIVGGTTAGIGYKLADKIWSPRKPNTSAPRSRNAANIDGARSEDAEAIDAWRHFHGRDPQKIFELQEQHVREGSYFMIGRMGALWCMDLEPDSDPNGWPDATITWKPNEGVRLASSIDGEQYYFMGGDQDFDRLAKGADWVDFGTVHGIEYLTEKSFNGFETIPYAHQFGEESGVRPSLWYCRAHRRLLLVGGDYRISDEQMQGASLGIVN